MKKVILTTAFCLVSVLNFAQAWNGKGDQKVQFGLEAWGYGVGVMGTYDYGFTNILSIGGGANFYFSHFQNNNDTNKVFIFGRLNAHLQEPLNLSEKWDIYPGLDMGILGKGFGFGAHIGVRYFFTDKIGMFLEAGNNGNLGISINL